MATIEIDGKKLDVQVGKMIIEVADDIGINIPRFCYHKKLSVAANCRMCLVEVEKSPKTLPACATPVTDGMKIYTQSPKAFAAQKGVMEFLLINHPLDCPVCDQGGECELQDVSMGFGSDHSYFTEGKRSVADQNLGSLISTEMTRCIQCTRCVRFGDEIAGLPELGVIYRGENERISTYVEHSMRSEISGNIIDLCPVGALTSKPSRFTARPWELMQYDSIAPHDCLGSNIHVHVRRNQVMRVVPKENEAVNETWISDRDRFSYLGLNVDRLEVPMVKQGSQWKKVDWETALTFLVTRFKQVIQQHSVSEVGALISPSSTLEESYLLQKLMRDLGSNNIDHRLHQSDFRDQDNAPLFPSSSMPYADIEKQKAIVLIGTNLHREVPLAAVRVRKASLNGSDIVVVNPKNYAFNFKLALKQIGSLTQSLAEIIVSLNKPNDLPPSMNKLLQTVKPNETSKQIAAKLLATDKPLLIIGAHVHNHPEASVLRSLIQCIAKLTNASTMPLTTGSNAAGAWLAGAVPHRKTAGEAVHFPGLTVHRMLNDKLKGYLLLGLEPELDCYDASLARTAMQQADLICAFTSYTSESMLNYAHFLLPIAPFTETSGTFINLEGRWQSFTGCVKPRGEARPAWKVFRVLGNLFGLKGFDYVSSEEVRDEVRDLVNKSNVQIKPLYEPTELITDASSSTVDWPMYGIDSTVRRAGALQRAASNIERIDG